jgi:hypothetical protein
LTLLVSFLIKVVDHELLESLGSVGGYLLSHELDKALEELRLHLACTVASPAGETLAVDLGPFAPPALNGVSIADEFFLLEDLAADALIFSFDSHLISLALSLNGAIAHNFFLGNFLGHDTHLISVNLAPAAHVNSLESVILGTCLNGLGRSLHFLGLLGDVFEIYAHPPIVHLELFEILGSPTDSAKVYG